LAEFHADGTQKTVIGMIHMGPLPGTPFSRKGDLASIVDKAVSSAGALYENGADGCLIQTVDRVYGVGEECDPARLAAVTLIVREIARATGSEFMIGVQIMRNALQASLAAAKVAGGSFIRASALVGRTLSPQGCVEPDPLALMNYRAKIDAWDIKIVAEIHSMHFRWHGEPKPVGEIARLAVQAGADCVCLGDRDEASTLSLIAEVRAAAPGIPIILAGYTDHSNAARLLAASDGAFVGAALERGGWGGAVDPQRVKDYVQVVRRSVP
jgi:uncharacterized protein